MTALGEEPVARTLDDILSDLDDSLIQIRHAADMVIDAAGSANITPALYDRLTFCAKTVEAFAHRAGVCSTEAIDTLRKVSAILKDDAA
ncbi:hypothetical protein [Reyranella sp.]|jgi:hypothetical protein|uniref:hypothetical protein n=1 Tax=Reyranella sp. TaxID=1929291 RepID=UPI000BDAA41C|nr:hypothetical protein [Reyranella sp.]OYY32966.1 MAG: hypothetical protein B7Y57_29930 [Rhodospirillales bacterium 35-66-84]OYZ90428.1 MAG: hypothetical protein B7Y08_29930 [Rhodospirillales bacterium 24-66-33]